MKRFMVVTIGACAAIALPGCSGGAPESPAAIPIDGGSYTWASGVTVRLDVLYADPYPQYGPPPPPIGDWAPARGDIYVQLRYTLTIPEDFQGTFDPRNTFVNGCPGPISAKNGNATSVKEFSSAETVKPSDQLLPGSTQFGVRTFFLRKDQASNPVYILSTCGGAQEPSVSPAIEPSEPRETALFTGVLPAKPFPQFHP